MKRIMVWLPVIANQTITFYSFFNLLHYNNLYCIKTSNILRGLIRKIVVHFYTDFSS